ncbi:hypothetical protein HY030_00375 [Candidatus Gottesmanbacteria bacterium]|nr:hypothetical protein [Candidatus Gottesmanbacteria bacterium]
MHRNFVKSFFIAFLVLLGFVYLYIAIVRPFNLSPKSAKPEKPSETIDKVLAARFDYLSTHGNSSCSPSFQKSILTMSDNARLQGSCCSPMNYNRYSKQVEGLKKYQDIKEVPPDPYDVEASLAKKLLVHYDDELTAEQQKAYDFAMQNSEEKGPCCCKCWRWYVYGGLAKVLIQKYHFTGQQVTEIWNLSDGCGGNS